MILGQSLHEGGVSSKGFSIGEIGGRLATGEIEEERLLELEQRQGTGVNDNGGGGGGGDGGGGGGGGGTFLNVVVVVRIIVRTLGCQRLHSGKRSVSDQ